MILWDPCLETYIDVVPDNCINLEQLYQLLSTPSIKKTDKARIKKLINLELEILEISSSILKLQGQEHLNILLEQKRNSTIKRVK